MPTLQVYHAKTATKYLTVNYRWAKHTSDHDFEEFLRRCLDAETDGGERFSDAPASRTKIFEGDGREVLLNECADLTDGVAGILCEVLPNSLQPILRRVLREQRLSSLTTAQIFELAEQTAGRDTDFVQGLCYFYVRKNHVLFATVKGFRKADVTDFFQWLYSRYGSAEQDLELEATLDKAEAGNKIGRVSKFSIKGRSGKGVSLGVDREVKKRVGAGTVRWSKAEAVVRAVVPENTFKELVDSLDEKNHLVADVQWSVSGPRGKKVKEALKSVVTELANMDDGIVGIAGKDGVVKDGGVILETRRKFDVAADKTFVMDFYEATDVLAEQLGLWVKDEQLAL